MTETRHRQKGPVATTMSNHEEEPDAWRYLSATTDKNNDSCSSDSEEEEDSASRGDASNDDKDNDNLEEEEDDNQQDDHRVPVKTENVFRDTTNITKEEDLDLNQPKPAEGVTQVKNEVDSGDEEEEDDPDDEVPPPGFCGGADVIENEYSKCPQCPVTFSACQWQKTLYYSHLKVHSASNFECTLCEIPFATMCSLSRHLNEFHSDLSPHNKRLMKKSQTQAAKRKMDGSSVAKIKKPVVCMKKRKTETEDSAPGVRRTMLTRIQDEEESDSDSESEPESKSEYWKCPYCPWTFPAPTECRRKIMYKSHIKVHNPPNYRCSHCNCPLATVYTLKRHVNRFHRLPRRNQPTRTKSQPQEIAETVEEETPLSQDADLDTRRNPPSLPSPIIQIALRSLTRTVKNLKNARETEVTREVDMDGSLCCKKKINGGESEVRKIVGAELPLSPNAKTKTVIRSPLTRSKSLSSPLIIQLSPEAKSQDPEVEADVEVTETVDEVCLLSPEAVVEVDTAKSPSSTSTTPSLASTELNQEVLRRSARVKYTKCPYCPMTFPSSGRVHSYLLSKHIKLHRSTNYKCHTCNCFFSARLSLSRHIKKCHPKQRSRSPLESQSSENKEVEECESLGSQVECSSTTTVDVGVANMGPNPMVPMEVDEETELELTASVTPGPVVPRVSTLLKDPVPELDPVSRLLSFLENQRETLFELLTIKEAPESVTTTSVQPTSSLMELDEQIQSSIHPDPEPTSVPIAIPTSPSPQSSDPDAEPTTVISIPTPTVPSSQSSSDPVSKLLSFLESRREAVLEVLTAKEPVGSMAKESDPVSRLLSFLNSQRAELLEVLK